MTSVSPSLRAAAGLTPEDAAVLQALAQGHDVTPAQIVQWAIRFFAYESPAGLRPEDVAKDVWDWLESVDDCPPIYSLAPAHGPTTPVANGKPVDPAGRALIS